MTDAEHTRRRLWRGAAFGLIAWAGPLLVAIASTPAIVRGLGAADYGLYALVVGLVSYSSTALLGRAVVRRVAVAHATDQLHTGVEMVHSAGWLAAGAGLAIAGTLWASGNWLAMEVFRLPPGDYRMAFGLAGAGIAASILSQVFASALHGLHRFDLYAGVATSMSIAGGIGCAVLALRGYGALGLVAWTVALAWLGCLLYAISARRLLGGHHAPPSSPPAPGTVPAARRRFSRATLIELLSHGGAVAVYQTCGYALLMFERTLLVRTLGAEALTYYAVAMNVAMPIHGFVAGSTLAVLPTASAAEARQTDIARIYLRSSRWANLVVVWLTLTGLICAGAFLRAWMGDAFAAQATPLLRVHVLAFGIMAAQVIAWQVAEGWGLASANAWFTAWWLASAVLLMPILGARFGIEGIAVARLFGLLAVPVFIAVIEHRVLGHVHWRAWLSGALQLLPAALAAAVLEYVLLQSLPSGWLGLAGAALAGGGAYVATLLLLGVIDRHDLRAWRARAPV